MRVEQLLERLDGVTGGDGQWHARCPSHDDRQASLTIGIGREGRILVTCWAGCELDDICRAVGVSVGDLFESRSDALVRETPPWGSNGLGRVLHPELDDVERWAIALQRSPETIARIHELKGWDGATLAAIDVGLKGERLTIPVRTPENELVAVLRYWPESSPKMLAQRGTPRTPLYLLLDEGGPIFIVEGETDAIAVGHMGLNVIGAPGASAKAHAEWLDVVRGRDVVVCFDVDEPGRRAAIRWANAAVGRGALSVRVLTLQGPTGYDVGELLLEHRGDYGGARRQLLALAADAPPHETPQQRTTPSELPPEYDDELVERAKPGEIIVRNLSTVQPRKVRVLWRERILRGRVGIVYGPPGQGKSTLIALLAADITGAGGRVLVASAEDDIETTIYPRMAAAGADVGLVDLISTRASSGETNLVLPRDVDALGARMSGAALLVIDPFTAHLGDDVNSWNEQSVRAQVLAPLAWLARRCDCTIVLIMHLNKSSGTDALSRISGTSGFGGAARFALLLGQHPDDIGLDEGERRLVLVHVKASETRKQLAMVFRRTTRAVTMHDGGIDGVPALELVDDVARISPEAVLEHTDPDEAGAFSEAIEYLRGELSDGPKQAKRLLAHARERGDFSERTLRKAKRALGVHSSRESDGWWWERRVQT